MESNEYSPRHDEKLNYKGPVSVLSRKICKEYGFGRFKSNKIIRSGFEDFNMRLNTTKGTYFVKVFARHRRPGTPALIASAMRKAMEAGISTPKIYKSRQGYLTKINVDGHVLPLCVTDFIHGRSLYKRGKGFSENDIRFLADQAAKMNSIKYKLKGGENIWTNPWSRVNLPDGFKERGRVLNRADKKLIEPIVDAYKKINMRKLPSAFVHGDINTTNVMEDNNGKLWIADFSTAAQYPRIIELAYFTTAFHGKTKKETKRKIRIALETYQKVSPLTKEELRVLPIVIKAELAVSVLNAVSFKKIFGDAAPAISSMFYKWSRRELVQLKDD